MKQKFGHEKRASWDKWVDVSEAARPEWVVGMTTLIGLHLLCGYPILNLYRYVHVRIIES